MNDLSLQGYKCWFNIYSLRSIPPFPALETPESLVNQAERMLAVTVAADTDIQTFERAIWRLKETAVRD